MSRVILGCGNFGGIGSSPAFFGAGETEAEAHDLMDAAWEAGITTFDTADAYGGGRSESFIGSWLRAKGPEVRERIVLATKTFNPMGEGEDSGLSAERIRRQIDASLTRLGVDAVPLYLAHAMDPNVTIGETIGAFEELVGEGMIRSYGGSNVDAAWLEEALRHGRPAWAQNSYSLLEREDENEAIRICVREGLGYTPYSPLAGGWLTGKYRRGEEPPPGSRMTLRPDPYLHFQDDRVFDALEAFEAQARERGTSPAALAIAWLLGDPNVTAVVVGPRRPDQLRPALEALDLQLSPSERDQLATTLRMSVLVIPEHDVRRLLPMDECIEAMESVLRSLARGELHQPLRFVTRPPGAESLMGFMPAHRSGDGSTWSLKEIVIAPGNPARGLDDAPGRRSPPRRRDRRAAGDPERVADHRDPDGRRVRRRHAGTRPTRSAHGRDPRRRCAGALARGRDALGARRRRDPVVEPPGRRDRRGCARGRRHRVHVHERARADPPARVARTGHARERRGLEPPEHP